MTASFHRNFGNRIEFFFNSYHLILNALQGMLKVTLGHIGLRHAQLKLIDAAVHVINAVVHTVGDHSSATDHSNDSRHDGFNHRQKQGDVCATTSRLL